MTILKRPLATLWQTFMVDHHFCPVSLSLLSPIALKTVWHICDDHNQLWAVAVRKLPSQTNVVSIIPINSLGGGQGGPPTPGVHPPYPCATFLPYPAPFFPPIFFRVPPPKIPIFCPPPFWPPPPPIFRLPYPRSPNPRAPDPPVLPLIAGK